MIVDRLVIHHTYDGPTAVDVSQNKHHGRLEGVQSGGGVAHFDGGTDCVRVLRSPTLAAMRAVRTTVRFRIAPGYLGIDPGYSGITGRRLNLIEGYLSFALVVDADRSLHGTILDRNGQWNGAQSAPEMVSIGSWHEASWVHDGFSACRLDLDGTTVAESFNVPGPVSAPQDPYGVAIGHWPGPGDQYTYFGDIEDVKVWMDRPDAAKDLVDGCCVDREGIDEAFEAVRDDPNFDPAVYNHAAQTMLDLGAKTFGGMAAGSEADRQHAWDLTRRFVLALGSGDRDSFVETVAVSTQLAAQRIPAATLEADSAALVAALQPTLLGPLIQAMNSGTTESEQQQMAVKLGLGQWMDAFCYGWAHEPSTPPKGEHGEPPKRPPPGPDHGTDPTTDRGPDDNPPSWGAGAEHHHDEPGADA